MKHMVATLLFALFALASAYAQTNAIFINNSQVTINNYTVIRTNVVDSTKKKTVLPVEAVERLRWESMLEERRTAAHRNYLNQRFPRW